MKIKIIALSLLITALFLSIVSNISSHSASALSFFASFDSTSATTSVKILNASAATGTPMLSLGNLLPLGTITANVNRSYASIQNTGAAPAYCFFNTTSTGLTSSTYGFVIQASSTVNNKWFALDGGSMYAGQVLCIAGSATTTLAVEEK